MTREDIIGIEAAKVNRRIRATIERLDPEAADRATQYSPDHSAPTPRQQADHGYFTAEVVASLAEKVEELTAKVGELEEAAKPRPRGRPPKERAS